MEMSWHSVAVFTCLIAVALPSTTARTIDEIISDAADPLPHEIDPPTDDDGSVRSAYVLDTAIDNDGSVLVELDMKLTREQWRVIEDSRDESARGRFLRKAVSDPSKRWPGKTIPYAIHNDFGTAARRVILEAMEEWELHTCLTFKHRTNETNYISIVNKTGCWSYVGMIGGGQELSLADGCLQEMVVAHELGHALGFRHEQSRPDRDGYVTIKTENIKEDHIHNFQKDNTLNSHGISYDYGSVMHYGQKYFSKNGRPTIITKDPEWQTRIGQRERLSLKDIGLARVIYNCECVNKNRSCSGWAALGYCEEGNRYRPYMLDNCAKACYGC